MDIKRKAQIKLFHGMKLGEKLKIHRKSIEALLGYKEGPIPKEVEKKLNQEIKSFYTYLDIQKQYVQIWQGETNYAYGVYSLGPRIQGEIEREADPLRKEILHILSVVALGIQEEEFLEEVKAKTGKYIIEVERPTKRLIGLPIVYNKKILEKMYNIKDIRVNKEGEFNYKYTKAIRIRLSSKFEEYIKPKPLVDATELWMTYRYMFYMEREEFFKRVKADYVNHEEKTRDILEQFSLETLKKYRSLGIPDKIFMDTFRNLKTQKEVEKAIDMKYFKIGRLGYQMLDIGEIKDLREKLIKLNTPRAKSALKKLNENRLGLLSVYVDNLGPLDYKACQQSYKEAAEFFIRYFIEIGDYEPRFAFVFNGWLLNPDLSNYLSEDTNIIKFQRDYEILGKNSQGTLMMKHIFGYQKMAISQLPEETQLQKSIKKALLEGKKFGSYRGIYFDANNDLGINYPKGLINYKAN